MFRTARVFCHVFTVLALLLSLVPVFAQTQQQLRAEFLASNPNNGWEYGFLDEDGKFTAYNTTFDDKQGIAGWALNNTPGPEGDITINYTDQPLHRYGVHWEPGQVCVHTPMHGKGVVVRWTAPDDASVLVDINLTNQTPISNANVAVLVDDTQLAADKLDERVANADDAPLLGDQAVVRSGFARSLSATVKKGGKVQLLISADDVQMSCHVGTFISVNAIGPGGVVLTKISFGSGNSTRQTETPVVLGKAD